MFSSLKWSGTLLGTLPLKCGRNHPNCSVNELYRTQSNLIEPVSIKHGLQTADHGLWTVYKSRTTIADKSSWKGLVQLNIVHFNPEKREFSLSLNIPRSPYSMLGYNRTIRCTNINVFINIGPGAGGGR